MCLPALQELRRVVPEAELTLVGRPWVLDIFPAAEMNCSIIPYDSRNEYRGVTGRWRFVEQLKKEAFDAAILFQNALDAAAVTAVAGIPIRAGYARHGRGPLLTHAVPPPRPAETPPHETYYYLELLRCLGMISILPRVEEIRLRAALPDRDSAKREMRNFLRLQQSDAPLLVGFGAGASFGTAKRWPADRFAEVAARLGEETGAMSVFFGSPGERPTIESLLPKAGRSAVSLAGKTSMQDFIRLVPACDLYVTNDTGTMHVAAALGVPTLAIFGPTDEHGTRPLGPLTRVISGEAECRPCKLRHCPIDHRCMISISVETVLEAARSMMAQRLQAVGQ
ncbi:MAG: lipopolysaccharide heptosyltransferase II [Acidobacteria bacterium]|nr:lipopolysaccharide heptosyltransferase II [Acidobacteriota bacterium]